MRLGAAFVVLFCTCLITSTSFGQTCPALMQDASRLVLVTVPSAASSTGTLRLFERPRGDADWRSVKSAEPVMVGRKGVAWSRAFRDLASNNEPIKVEGDDRSPAGIYRVGRPFGFASSSLVDYLRTRFRQRVRRGSGVSGL